MSSLRLSRHRIGSSMFWYLPNPAGNFSEHYSDLDCVLDAADWTLDGSQGLYNSGQLPPADWMVPNNIAAGMVGLQSTV